MLAFQEKDAKFFFGRETFVDGLVRVVQQQPLVAVIGSSGSGKSSVVLAGLIPKLQEAGCWLIGSFRPNKQPFYELAAALISQLEPELGKTDKTIKAKELANSIRQHGFTADVSAILKDKPGKRLLLVVDQFEELYTGCADTEQQQFVDALLAVVESASGAVTLVLTLRADFYSYVVNYPRFGEALNKYPAQNLSLMNVEEMQAAIELPAKKMGVKLEQGLTQRILDDVKQEPGNLPLLEFALTQLWDKQSQGQLTHQAYSEIGEVAKALSNHAEGVYGKLSEQEQKQAQRIFIQLVRPGEGTEDTRRVATRREVGEECWDLIRYTDGLADARLVVTGRNEATGEETVEVVHEALIREWGSLCQWIDENRKKLIQKQEIEDAAKKWGDRGKGKDYLLGGKVLTEAKVFQKQETGNLTLSDLAKDFIRQSLRHRRIGTLKTASLLTIPLLIIFIAVLPLWRKAQEQKAWETIRTRGVGTREALELLIEGCWKRSQWRWIPDYLATPLFGNCADLTGANLSRTNLSGANLSFVNLSSADLSGADLSGANLSGADLSSADLSIADLSIANLSGADLSVANLSGAHLSFANLSSAKLSRTNLSGANLSVANLSNADLNFANLSNTDLSIANLSNTDLSNVNLSCIASDAKPLCTNFWGAENLTPEQVKSARNWQQAIYDEEFRKKLGLK